MANTNGRQNFDGREMVAVHDMLRREFALLPGLVAGVTAGDHDRAQIVGDHIEALMTVLHHHHRSEDEYVWPLLLDRCAESVAPLVGLMEDQHERVATLRHEIDEALSVWRHNATVESREALVDVLDRLIPPLTEHLSDEEERRRAAHGAAHHRRRVERDGERRARPTPTPNSCRLGSGC